MGVAQKSQKKKKKNLEEKHRTLFDINGSNIFLDPSSKVKKIKAKISKWDLIKPKSFCTAKETTDKMKRQHTEWKKIFANDMMVNICCYWLGCTITYCDESHISSYFWQVLLGIIIRYLFSDLQYFLENLVCCQVPALLRIMLSKLMLKMYVCAIIALCNANNLIKI